MSPDPAGQYHSPYLGMGNDPINGVDPDGMRWYENSNGDAQWFSGWASWKAFFSSEWSMTPEWGHTINFGTLDNPQYGYMSGPVSAYEPTIWARENYPDKNTGRLEYSNLEYEIIEFAITAGTFKLLRHGLKKAAKEVAEETIETGVSKILPRSGSIIRSLGAASKPEMLARKLKLNLNSPTARQVLNSLDDKVNLFITKYRKPSIRAKLPGEFLNMTVEQALKSKNTTVRKLLIDNRFVK